MTDETVNDGLPQPGKWRTLTEEEMRADLARWERDKREREEKIRAFFAQMPPERKRALRESLEKALVATGELIQEIKYDEAPRLADQVLADLHKREQNDLPSM
jgi:hypothetical protein